MSCPVIPQERIVCRSGNSFRHFVYYGISIPGIMGFEVDPVPKGRIIGICKGKQMTQIKIHIIQPYKSFADADDRVGLGKCDAVCRQEDLSFIILILWYNI